MFDVQCSLVYFSIKLAVFSASGAARIASVVPLTAAYPAAIVTAMLAGKAVFTRHFSGGSAGFLGDKYLAL